MFYFEIRHLIGDVIYIALGIVNLISGRFDGKTESITVFRGEKGSLLIFDEVLSDSSNIAKLV